MKDASAFVVPDFGDDVEFGPDLGDDWDRIDGGEEGESEPSRRREGLHVFITLVWWCVVRVVLGHGVSSGVSLPLPYSGW